MILDAERLYNQAVPTLFSRPSLKITPWQPKYNELYPPISDVAEASKTEDLQMPPPHRPLPPQLVLDAASLLFSQNICRHEQ